MRGLMVLVFATALMGCVDSDGDGVRDKKDCQPLDPDVFPGQKEVCNGQDDDCNGQVDEDVAIVAYWDRDLDGYGDTAYARRVCKLPDDGSEVSGDCDDLDPTVHPDAAELCDEQDNDCDGEIDNDVVPLTFYADGDGDGYGAAATTLQDCIAPDGYVGNTDDCNDAEPLAWSGAAELCDGIDNDCNGSIDEGLPLVQVWADADGDGAGDPNAPSLACGPSSGWSADDRDCDDTNPALGGGSLEVQGNGIDEDCDGYVDEYGVPAPFATYQDALAAMGGAGTGTEVVQFDDGWHQVTINALDANVIFAGEGCGRTTIYAATPEPVATLNSGGIEGLTLTGGTGARGGGLRVEGGEVWAVGICVEGNAASSRGGGVAVVDEGTLHLYDSLVRWNRAEQVGGGVYGHAGTVLDVRRTQVLGNEAATYWGGGIAIRGGHLDLTNSVVAGNLALDSGGGIYVANELAPPTGATGTVDDVLWDGSATIAWTTVHGNRLDPVLGDAGTGLLLGGTVALVDHVTFSGHPEGWDTIKTKSSNLTNLPSGNRPGVLLSSDLHFRGNADYDKDGTWYLEAGRGSPDFANVLPTLDPGEWDLRYLDESDWAVADVGAWGGPDAMWDDSGPTPLWRPWPRPDSALVDDTDGDGLFDAFETRWGLDPIQDDATADPDLDGLDNLAEQAARTDPHLADTDVDGVDDPTEVGLADDPRDPSDHRPLANVGADRYALVGLETTLSAMGSVDPNGDPLAYTWSVIAAPFGSVATFVDPTAMDGRITPDQPGLYTVELAVDDGAGVFRTTRWIDARTGVIVPDQAATLQEALALTYDGQGIFVRAGTWGPVDLSGRGVAIVGLDPTASVILDAAGASAAVYADDGAVALASVTLTGGNAEMGGGLAAIGTDSLTLRDVVIRGNSAGLGGGLYAQDTLVDARWIDVRDNFANEGGGIYAIDTDLDLTGRIAKNTAWHGGGLWIDGGEFLLENTEIQSNVAVEGSGIWLDDHADLLMNNCATAGNKGESVVYSNKGLVHALGTLWLEEQAEGRQVAIFAVSPSTLRLMRNHDGGDPTFWYNVNIGAADEPMGSGDPQVVSWIDDGNPDNDLLIPRPTSPLIDMGWPEWTDPDGSDSDVGLSAGSRAAPTAVQGQWDSDGDGMDDAWETFFGLDPHDASDVGSDADGDGWVALDEYVVGTNPNAADSDGDGADDPTELAGGTDPTSSQEDLPLAIVAAGAFGSPGDPHTIDGSMSTDPVPGPSPLSFAWRVLLTPPGSAITDADIVDPTAAITEFTPDVGGRYLLGLIVNDGLRDSLEAVLEVRPRRYLEVPSAYATIADAYAVAQPGLDVVHLEPGIHDLHQVDWIPGVPIQGYGIDQTYVHGLPGWAAFEVDTGESAEISDLTIAGSNGNYGGGLDCVFGTVDLQRVRFEFNTAWEGGAMRSNTCDVVLTDVDMLDNDVSSRGGGFTGILGTLNWTRGEVARNSSDAVGGGIYLDNVDASISNVVFHHNQTDSGGAAINQAIRVADPLDPFDLTVPKRLILNHVTVAGNDGRDGALYLNLATVTNSIVQQNANKGLFESSSLVAAAIDVSYTSIYGNQTGDFTGDDINIGGGVVNEDAHFTRFDPYDGGGWDADFRLPLASPLIDLGAPGAPLDPDGSRTDMGAFSGPATWTDWDQFLVDTDGDGMADAFELAHGLDPLNGSDAGNDADLDGRSNLWEHDNFTDPTLVDSDGDGVNDDVEDLAGDDPTDPSDHAPVAVPEADITGALPFVQQNINGIGSYDPDGDLITAWQWTFVSVPGRSTLIAPDDLTNPTSSLVSFTPDTPGTFELGLTVTAGGVTSAQGRVRITVNGSILVPEDYPSVPEAIAAAGDGQTIDIGPGTWPTVADLEGKDLTLIGAGAGVTILDGEGFGTVLLGDNGEQLTLRDLTITGGMAAEGGGIHIEGSLGRIDLMDVDLVGNSGIYGGAVYIRSGDLVATGVRFVDNDVGRNGGAIYSTGSDVDLVQTLVAGNLSTSLHGGGINHYDNTLTLVNCVFADNHTEAHGGAIYVNGPDDLQAPYPNALTDVFIDQTLLVGNSAGQEASALKFVKANIELHNTLIAHNRDGDGAVVAQGTVNTFVSQYGLAYDNDTAHFDLSSNLNLFLYVPYDGDPSGNLLDRNAQLTGFTENGDWSDDDYGLGAGSAALDAGDPAVSDLDATRSDIGAFGGPQGGWIP